MRGIVNNSISSLYVAQIRGVCGVAPVIFIPRFDREKNKSEILEKNTNTAIELLRCIKGNKPPAYVRKYSHSFRDLSTEVENLIGSAAKLRKNIQDDEPSDKLTAIERMLRHALWSYLKDEGSSNFAEMDKWLVYTQLDMQKSAALRSEHEKRVKYESFKAERKRTGGAENVSHLTPPEMNLAEEYNNVIDREVVVEKRWRYDALSRHSTERNEAAIKKENAAYLKPIQARRLDYIVELLEKFKPMLAHEAIMQRLTIKHLEGQLGQWRYLDWNPEVRDRAELEADNNFPFSHMPHEEKRLLSVHLKSKAELIELAEKTQAHIAAKKSSGKRIAGTDGASLNREKLIAEIVRLQQRAARKETDAEVAEDPKERNSGSTQAEEESVTVSDEAVQKHGLLGLDVIQLASRERNKAK